ncbi:MAG: alpha/beta hydrolase [Saprospiraceae bacterium]
MAYILTNGIKMYYEVHGEGPPLLLIMGITAPGAVWEKHLNYWKSFFKCIVADNRGVGNSDKPPGPYSTEQMAEDYHGLLEALQVSKVRVVGVSMGSTIAMQLCLRHPDEVSSMVLMCPWARCDRMARSIFEHMIAIKGKLTPAEFARYIQLLIFHKSSWDHDDVYQEMIDGRLAAQEDESPQPFHALEAQAIACMEHDVLSQLHNIFQTCLILGGKADIFTPEWMARDVAAAIPGSDLHLYDHSGHAFHWENLDDFNRRVKDWLLHY